MRGDIYKHLVGTRVGYLDILSIDCEARYPTFTCKCSCGKMIKANASNVAKPNHTTSCGCYRKEIGSLVNSTHRLVETKEYSVWTNVKTRCTNKNNPSYPRYGGRGIKICNRWANSFEDFLSDVGICPSKNHSLDRIDNNGNYEPGNVKWSTQKEQCNNTRQNRMVEYKGQIKTLPQWCDEFNISYGRTSRRLYAGWPTHEAFTLPNVLRLPKSIFRET